MDTALLYDEFEHPLCRSEDVSLVGRGEYIVLIYHEFEHPLC